MNLQSANRAMNTAAVLALISAGISLVLTLTYATGGNSLADVDIWSWIDVVVLLGCALSVYLKSRAGAGVLLIYYTASKLISWLTAGALIGVPISLVFIYFFFQGFRGAMAYHQLNSQTAVA